MWSSLSCPPCALGQGWRAFALTHTVLCMTDAGLLSSQRTGILPGSLWGSVCIHILHQPLCCYFPQANSTMEVPVTPSSLPEQEGKESETPIHQHNPLHPHHHHEVSSEGATDPSGDHEPATRTHHHHRDHSQPHHEGKKQKEGNEH